MQQQQKTSLVNKLNTLCVGIWLEQQSCQLWKVLQFNMQTSHQNTDRNACRSYRFLGLPVEILRSKCVCVCVCVFCMAHNTRRTEESESCQACVLVDWGMRTPLPLLASSEWVCECSVGTSSRSNIRRVCVTRRCLWLWTPAAGGSCGERRKSHLITSTTHEVLHTMVLHSRAYYHE